MSKLVLLLLFLMIGAVSVAFAADADSVDNAKKTIPPVVQNEIGLGILLVLFLGLIMIGVVIGGARYYRMNSRVALSRVQKADDGWFEKPLNSPWDSSTQDDQTE